MRPALVTGASGFVGWHVARVLRERGYRVRALVRAGSRVDALDVEPVTGDLRDADSLARAVAGCGLVFHVAADYRLWAKEPAELYRSNVDGTRNLLEASQQAASAKLISKEGHTFEVIRINSGTPAVATRVSDDHLTIWVSVEPGCELEFG